MRSLLFPAFGAVVLWLCLEEDSTRLSPAFSDTVVPLRKKGNVTTHLQTKHITHEPGSPRLVDYLGG